MEHRGTMVRHSGVSSDSDGGPSSMRSMLSDGSLSRFNTLARMPTGAAWTLAARANSAITGTIWEGDREGSDSDFSEEEVNDEEKRQLRNKTFVYFTFCLGVQMFMSYDGGATPASLDTIQERVQLSETEIGLLGALDKVGQTMFSMVWGRAVQIYPTKILLASALLMNAIFSLTFGVVFNKYAMFAAKFAQGATESLQGVWGTVWTLQNAPESSRTQWMGLGAIASGLGNGVGTMVAGFTTANGLPYSLAYVFQASMLGIFWFLQVLTPGRFLSLNVGRQAENADKTKAIQLPTIIEEDQGPLLYTEEESAKKDRSRLAVDEEPLGVASQLRALWGNRLYLRTSLCISQIYFWNSGVQFIWTRTFVEGPWQLNKNIVVVAFILVTGVGSFLGVILGPTIVDKHGGYADDVGKHRSLGLLLRFSAMAVVFAGIASFAVVKRMQSDEQLEQHIRQAEAVAANITSYSNRTASEEMHYQLAEMRDMWWLWTVWISVLFVYLCLNATLATHTAINCEAVPKSMQTFATGTTVSIQNMLGYAAGAFVPGVVMDLANMLYTQVNGASMTDAGKLGVGVVFVCCITVTLLMTVALAFRAAAMKLPK